MQQTPKIIQPARDDAAWAWERYKAKAAASGILVDGQYKQRDQKPAMTVRPVYKT